MQKTDVFRIAAVINNLDAAKEEQQAAQDAQHSHHALLLRIEELKADLERFERVVRAMPKTNARAERDVPSRAADALSMSQEN